LIDKPFRHRFFAAVSPGWAEALKFSVSLSAHKQNLWASAAEV
jgi:hypothetical protein